MKPLHHRRYRKSWMKGRPLGLWVSSPYFVLRWDSKAGPFRWTGSSGTSDKTFPAVSFRFAQIPISKWHSGDVFVRAWVRWLEIQRSGAFLREQLASLPEGPILMPVGPLLPDHVVVSFVEGWRGEICHVAITDSLARFAVYKVVDPSFHNWMGLAIAMRNQQISDFPLCNKSFNLSYCGHDL
jgi:Ni,Fe-hydrogenase III large subunit